MTVGEIVVDQKREGFGKVTEITETKNQDGRTVMYCEHILLVEMKGTPNET